MVIVEESQRLHPCRVLKVLIAVHPVLISLDVSGHHEFEKVSEEVHLCSHGFHGVIESSICIILEAHLPIDVPSPHHILRHRSRGWECYFGTSRDIVGIRLRSLLLVIALRLRLRQGNLCQTCHKTYNQYASHLSMLLIYKFCYFTMTSMAPGSLRVMPSGPVADTFVI